MFSLPNDIEIGEAVMLSSALPAAVHAVRRAGDMAGSTVLISGVGSIGLTVVQVVKALGAATIVAADVSDERLSIVRQWADATLNVADVDPAQAANSVRELAGAAHGLDFAFETAGNPASLEQTVRAISPGGTALLMGIIEEPTGILFKNYLAEFIRREVSLVTTFGFIRRDFLVGNALYSTGSLDPSYLTGDTVKLDAVPGLLADIEQSGTQGKRHIIDFGI